MKDRKRHRTSVLAVLATSCLAASLSISEPARAEETVGRTGTFVSAGRKSVEGSVRIVTRDGMRYVQIEDGFRSDEGPDLYVLLHQQAKPKSYKRKYFTELGRLQAVSGGQWYAIPEDADLAAAHSVVIRCKKFGVTFGYAPLGRE